MKLPQPYKCDYCTNVKGEANHWWLQFKSKVTTDFILTPWGSGTNPDSEQVDHICSEQCAAKALSKWMAEVRTRAVYYGNPLEDMGATKVHYDSETHVTTTLPMLPMPTRTI